MPVKNATRFWASSPWLPDDVDFWRRKNWVDHMPVDSWTLDKVWSAALNVGLPDSSAPAQLLDGKLNSSNEKNELGVLHSIIRSKGFVWLASHAQSALYWSHAGERRASEAGC
mmetsp:Transcript_6403/g.22896  ORF Transcript_6403/g.22896 Transcript_6403/m.22896 type:complete len:113 (-) Transcript_6403:2488-2826(-)